MKRTLLVVALALFAVSSQAAIQYEYLLKNITEDAVVPTSDLTAKATIDGTRARVEFIDGNIYPPGTYVVTSDGTRLFFVDPANKWFTEFNAVGAVSAIGANDIRITNQVHDLKKLDDGPTIAGVRTDHYRLVIDYDMTVMMRSIPAKVHVQTTIDSYTTAQFGAVSQPIALLNGVRTGNVEVDKLLDLETTIPGFPMKQTVAIRTTFQNRAAQSKLEVNPTRTILREMRVTSLRETIANAGDFLVPKEFKRAEPGEMPRTATQVLTFEPASK